MQERNKRLTFGVYKVKQHLETMTTTKIRTGVYKHINKYGETWILRGGQYWEAGETYWVSNQCDTLDECSDNNSSGNAHNSKKEAIQFLND